MEILLAYAAGLLTLINPCVLPVLPVVLAGALQADKKGPVVLAAGMSLSFVFLGVTVTAFGYSIGLTPDRVADAGAVLMILFGLVMLVPAARDRFSLATAGIASGADGALSGVDQSKLRGQFVGGLLLGAVWSPCIGPTLGSAIALASQGEGLGQATLIMTGFALGVSTLIVGIGYGARGILMRNRATMMRVANAAPKIMGLIFLAVGLALLLRLHHVADAYLINILPAWLVDLSVAI